MANRRKAAGRNTGAAKNFGADPTRDYRKIMFFVLDAILLVIFVLIIVMNNQNNKVNTSTDADGETVTAAAEVETDEPDEPADIAEAEGSDNLLALSAREDGPSVTWTFRESFDEDYYDFDELKEAVEAEAETFNDELAAGGAGTACLTVQSCELKSVTTDGQEGKCVEVVLAFDSVETFLLYYNEYTNPDEEAYLFCGTIADAQEEGYVFEELYENGGGDVAYLTEELMQEDTVYAILTNLEIDLQIEDTVLCWDDGVTQEEGLYHTVSGSQNTVIAAVQ